MEHLGCYSASKRVCLETEWKSGFWWKFKTSEKAVVGQISEGFLSKWSYINREAKIPLKQFKIPDSSQQKYFWGNEVIFSEIPQKQKKVPHWKSAWFPTQGSLCCCISEIVVFACIIIRISKALPKYHQMKDFEINFPVCSPSILFQVQSKGRTKCFLKSRK